MAFGFCDSCHHRIKTGIIYQSKGTGEYVCESCYLKSCPDYDMINAMRSNLIKVTKKDLLKMHKSILKWIFYVIDGGKTQVSVLTHFVHACYPRGVFSPERATMCIEVLLEK